MSTYKEMAYIHTDLDGVGCSILYHLAHRDDLGITSCLRNVDNGDLDAAVLKDMEDGVIDEDTFILFADICATRPVLEKLKEAGYENVQVIDHHRTNFFAQMVYPNAIIIPENEAGKLESGTSLLWQYYANEYVNTGKKEYEFTDHGVNIEFLATLVDTIRSYDTYEWKSTNNQAAKELQVLFQLLGFNRFLTRYLDKITNTVGNVPLISMTDMDFVSNRIEMEQDVINNFGLDDIYDVSYNGRRGALVLSTKGANISELGYQFLSNHPEFDFMVSFTLSRNGEFSFRAVKDDIDLGKEFAAPIGGGGHPKAAGAKVSNEFMDYLVDQLLDYLTNTIRY